MTTYLLLKMLHLLGVVLFLGNIIVTALWKILADNTKDIRVIVFSQKLVLVTDIVFTSTGVVLVSVTGLMLAPYLGGLENNPWMVKGLALFSLSGILWGVFLLPIQVLQHRMAKQALISGTLEPRFWLMNKVWSLVGVIATLVPLANLYFMVAKPQ